MYKPWQKPLAQQEQKQKFSPDLDGLIAWLRTKPPEEQYNWSDVRRCALRQFADANEWSGGYTEMLGGWRSNNCRILEHLAACKPHTFGAALARALELKEKRE